MAFFYHGELISGQQGPPGPDGNPLGTVISFMGAAAPAGYLACDGGLHSLEDYPELAAFFREQFGAENHFGGDGTTTFAVPDLRNLFLRGYHGGGEERLSGETGQRQEATSHVGILTIGNGVTGAPATRQQASGYDSATMIDSYYGWNKDGTNSSETIETYTARPVNMAVLYCVKAAPSGPVLEEYGTEDGWHVRKWSGGYVEMLYAAVEENPQSSWVTWGGVLIQPGAVPAKDLPVPLVQKLYECAALPKVEHTAFWLSPTSTPGSSVSLEKTEAYSLLKGADPVYGVSYSLNIFVAGRWK